MLPFEIRGLMDPFNCNPKLGKVPRSNIVIHGLNNPGSFIKDNTKK